MIEKRTYRNLLKGSRFQSLTVGYKDTDLWIGVNPESYSESMIDFAVQKIKLYRKQLEELIVEMPLFASSFVPISLPDNAIKLAKEMNQASRKANTGPMAAVAGVIAEQIGKDIAQQFQTREIIVENGGDIYVEIQRPLVLSVFAGNSPLSEKVGIEIPPNDSPLGICTSAGTVGPSKSFGKADAVMVACKNTALADALATAIGNKIISGNDIENELLICNKIKEIISLIIICDGKIGIRGKYELKLTNFQK